MSTSFQNEKESWDVKVNRVFNFSSFFFLLKFELQGQTVEVQLVRLPYSCGSPLPPFVARTKAWIKIWFNCFATATSLMLLLYWVCFFFPTCAKVILHIFCCYFYSNIQKHGRCGLTLCGPFKYPYKFLNARTCDWLLKCPRWKLERMQTSGSIPVVISNLDY